MSEKKKYVVLADGMDYPSAKDGKRYRVDKGAVVDDLLPSEIKDLLKRGVIAEARATDTKKGVSE